MSLMFLHLLSVVNGISEVVSVVYDIVYHILVFQQSSTRFVTPGIIGDRFIDLKEWTRVPVPTTPLSMS